MTPLHSFIQNKKGTLVKMMIDELKNEEGEEGKEELLPPLPLDHYANKVYCPFCTEEHSFESCLYTSKNCT